MELAKLKSELYGIFNEHNLINHVWDFLDDDYVVFDVTIYGSFHGSLQDVVPMHGTFHVLAMCTQQYKKTIVKEYIPEYHMKTKFDGNRQKIHLTLTGHFEDRVEFHKSCKYKLLASKLRSQNIKDNLNVGLHQNESEHKCVLL